VICYFTCLNPSGNELACHYSAPDGFPGCKNRLDSCASTSELLVALENSSIIFREIRSGRACILDPGKKVGSKDWCCSCSEVGVHLHHLQEIDSIPNEGELVHKYACYSLSITNQMESIYIHFKAISDTHS
jgi:hypothetical protein